MISNAAATDPIAHDPTIIKQGDYYYSFITGDAGTQTYLPIRRSTDLIHWTFLGTVFADPPAWVVEALGFTPDDFWAPDINYFNGQYYLYYAASEFGTNNSVIGLATNQTLDPNSSAYQWVDEGMVLRTNSQDNYNAIDPDLSFDAGGVPWLSFGSFWDGIKMYRVDASSGKLSTADTTLYSLASRGGDAIEGPSIVRRGDYYYLFVSFDHCCNGVDSDYRVMVGRATQQGGPYYDRNGVALLEGGGTELLRGYNEFAGTGHGDVYLDGTTYWFAHHYYDRNDNGAPKLSIREISWSNGWPTLGDPLSGSSEVGHGGAYMHIVNLNSGKVLDNDDCGYDGANIQLWTQLNNACQQWRLEYRGGGHYSILNKYSNKVVDVANCQFSNGANIAQWRWLNNACQRFRFISSSDGWLGIENENSLKVLDANACGTADGTNIRQWRWLNNACQLFRLEPVGLVKLVNLNSSKVVDAAACNGADGDNLVQRSASDSSCQLWRFTHTDSGYYTIANQGHDLLLGVENCGSGGANLVLRSASTADSFCQQWRIEPLNDGTFRLVNRESAKVIDVADCSTADEANIQQWDWLDNTCQRFKIVIP